MDIEGFKSVIREGEGKKVEFKSAQVLRNPNGENSYKIAKEIVALANRRGGYLIFGIDDESGGIEEYELLEDRSRETISNIASDRCSPPINFDCYYFDNELDGGSQAFVVEVGPKKQIPHAIVDNSKEEIQRREYRIRAGEDSRLVTDSELYSLFKGYTGQRILGSSVVFVPIDVDQQTPKYIEPYPEGYQSFDTFLSEISTDEWDWIINGGNGENSDERIQKLAAEFFPFAVLDSLPADFWVHYIEDDIGEDDIGEEDVDEMFDYVDYVTVRGLEYDDDDLYQDMDLLISEIDVDPIQILKDNGWHMHIPKGTDVTLGHIDPYNSGLLLEKDDIFSCSVGFSGAVVGRTQGLEEKHPLSDLIDDQNIISPTLTIDIKGKFGYPDIEDPHIQDHQIYIEGLYEMMNQLWDWERCLNNAPSMGYRLEHKLDDIDEKVNQLLHGHHR